MLTAASSFVYTIILYHIYTRAGILLGQCVYLRLGIPLCMRVRAGTVQYLRIAHQARIVVMSVKKLITLLYRIHRRH